VERGKVKRSQRSSRNTEAGAKAEKAIERNPEKSFGAKRSGKAKQAQNGDGAANVDSVSALEVVSQASIPSTDFIKTEKNLMSMAFFTPSNKRIPGHKKKTVSFTRVIDGHRVEARAIFLPSAEYGLPITADQDLYMALLKIVTEIQRRDGKVTNPVAFTSAEILRIQGKSVTSGYHYKELVEQLMRIKTTTIVSEGAVYLSGKKVWAKDAFNVLDRVVFYGHQLEDGTVADRNYVWFSEWQLENINNKHLLPIDYDTYKQLKNHITKALVPLLQIWLYASREDGFFEKRYDEICQLLNVSQYEHLSKIKEKFGPSLEELTANGYLQGWRIDRTSDSKGYKIVFFHGEKFHRDRRRRIAQRDEGAKEMKRTGGRKATDEQPGNGIDDSLVAELSLRGITDGQARSLLLEATEDQQVMDQVEWGDYLISKSPGKFYNPAGFYIYLVKENVTPPATFESSRIKRLREEVKQATARAHDVQAQLELAYEEYQDAYLDKYISENFSSSEFADRVEAKKRDLIRQYKNMSSWDVETLSKLATTAVRGEVAKQVPFLSLASFCKRERKKK
jgi:hypothetical protein